MSQANLAWQLMMGADDKIVIGTILGTLGNPLSWLKRKPNVLSGALGILIQIEELMRFAVANHLTSLQSPRPITRRGDILHTLQPR